MNVISSKNFEDLCKLPILLSTIGLFVILTPIKMIGLHTLFLKHEKVSSSRHIQVTKRRQAFTKRFIAPI